MEEEKERKNISDILRKVVSTGVSAAFMTEDAVKELISGLPLPKEMVGGLLQNAKASRDEFIASVKNELKGRLDRIDVSKEVDRVLSNYDLEITAKVRFNRKTKDTSSNKKGRSKEE